MLKQKTIFKTFLCMLLVALLCGSMACSLVPEDETAEKPLFTEKELQTNVIQIGDYTVTLEEYLNIYNEVANYYSYSYGYDITSSEEELAQYKGMITDTLVQEHMMLYRAAELGLDQLTEEQQAEVEADYQASLEDLYGYYTELAENDKANDDSINVEEKVEEYIVEDAEYYLGEGATVDEYKEYLHQSAHDAYVTNLLEEYLTSDIEVTEDEIKTYYNTALTSGSSNDETYYTENPGSYKNDQETFELTGKLPDEETSVQPLYIPEGYSRVLHIYAAPQGDLSEDYTANEKKMDELTTEYGKLAIRDAASGSKTNSKRMNEIVKEYKKLQDANEKERKEYFESAHTKINQAYDALKELGKTIDAAQFTEIMAEYTEDAYIIGSDVIRESGRLISNEHESKEDWSQEVKSAFAKLKIGEYSDVIEDEDGYHIIYYISDVTSGVVSLDDVHDQISAVLLAQNSEKAFNDKVTEWMDDEEGVIVLNEDLIAEVGTRKNS